MYRSKLYKPGRRSIYARRNRRRGPLVAAVTVVVAVLALFVGWSIAPTVIDLATGKYRASSGSSSGKASSSHTVKPSSSSASSGTSQTNAAALRGIYLPESCLSDMSGIDSEAAAAKKAGLNLAVVQLKGEDGLIGYTSKISEATSDMIAQGAPDAAAAAQELTKNGLTPAAEISCFKDPVAPKSMMSASVLYSGDHSLRWLDNSGSRWLNPYSTAAQQYIIDLAKEAVSLGYKTVYLTNVEFPTNDAKAWYGDGMPSKEEVLKSFVAQAAKQVQAVGGKLSVVMPGAASVGQGDAQTGQDQNIFGFSANYFSPNLCPSLMPLGITVNGTSLAKPDLTPGNTVTAAAGYLKTLTGEKPGATVPFLQAYTNTSLGGGNYTQYAAADINAEIAALKSAGITNFVLYAPDGKYDLSGVSIK